MIGIHSMALELCLMKKKKKERKRKNKVTEIFLLGLFTSLKVSRAYRVDLAIKQQRDLVSKLFALLYLLLCWSFPFPLQYRSDARYKANAF